MTKEEKSYYVYVDGKKVEVSEEVYRTIRDDEWREKKRRQRAWRCRDGKGHRCNKNCMECDVYRYGKGPNGNTISLEGLYEESEFEPASDMDVEGTVIWAMLLDQLLKELEEFMPDGRQIAEMLIEEFTEKEMASVLGIPVSTLQYHKKKVKEFIRDFLNR